MTVVECREISLIQPFPEKKTLGMSGKRSTSRTWARQLGPRVTCSDLTSILEDCASPFVETCWGRASVECGPRQKPPSDQKSVSETTNGSASVATTSTSSSGEQLSVKSSPGSISVEKSQSPVFFSDVVREPLRSKGSLHTPSDEESSVASSRGSSVDSSNGSSLDSSEGSSVSSDSSSYEDEVLNQKGRPKSAARSKRADIETCRRRESRRDHSNNSRRTGLFSWFSGSTKKTDEKQPALLSEDELKQLPQKTSNEKKVPGQNEPRKIEPPKASTAGIFRFGTIKRKDSQEDQERSKPTEEESKATKKQAMPVSGKKKESAKAVNDEPASDTLQRLETVKITEAVERELRKMEEEDVNRGPSGKESTEESVNFVSAAQSVEGIPPSMEVVTAHRDMECEQRADKAPSRSGAWDVTRLEKEEGYNDHVQSGKLTPEETVPASAAGEKAREQEHIEPNESGSKEAEVPSMEDFANFLSSSLSLSLPLVEVAKTERDVAVQGDRQPDTQQSSKLKVAAEQNEQIPIEECIQKKKFRKPIGASDSTLVVGNKVEEKLEPAHEEWMRPVGKSLKFMTSTPSVDGMPPSLEVVNEQSHGAERKDESELQSDKQKKKSKRPLKSGKGRSKSTVNKQGQPATMVRASFDQQKPAEEQTIHTDERFKIDATEISNQGEKETQRVSKLSKSATKQSKKVARKPQLETKQANSETKNSKPAAKQSKSAAETPKQRSKQVKSATKLETKQSKPAGKQAKPAKKETQMIGVHKLPGETKTADVTNKPNHVTKKIEQTASEANPMSFRVHVQPLETKTTEHNDKHVQQTEISTEKQVPHAEQKEEGPELKLTETHISTERRGSTGSTVSSLSEWKSITDPVSGRLYYYHPITRQTTWTDPKTEETEKADDDINDMAKNSMPTKPTWMAMCSVRDGKMQTYYHNRLTKASTWTKPDEFEEELDAYQETLEKYSQRQMTQTEVELSQWCEGEEVVPNFNCLWGREDARSGKAIENVAAKEQQSHTITGENKGEPKSELEPMQSSKFEGGKRAEKVKRIGAQGLNNAAQNSATESDQKSTKDPPAELVKSTPKMSALKKPTKMKRESMLTKTQANKDVWNSTVEFVEDRSREVSSRPKQKRMKGPAKEPDQNVVEKLKSKAARKPAIEPVDESVAIDKKKGKKRRPFHSLLKFMRRKYVV